MAIKINVTLTRVDAVWNAGDFRFHHFSSCVKQSFLVGFKTLSAVLVEQFFHTALADGAGTHLSTQVVLDDVEADIGKDQIPNVFAQLTFLVDLYRWDA